MTTRVEFLSRIRGEIAKRGRRFSASVEDRPGDPRAAAETVRRELAKRWPATLDRFRSEFERVGGVFHRARSLEAVPQVIAGIARQREARRLVAWSPHELGADLGPALAARGLEPVAMPAGTVQDPQERARLRRLVADAELGLTGVDLAIAETGTLVMRSGPGRHRSTSLLPPYHVALFDRTVLVESLSQAGIFLEAWHAGGEPEDVGAIVSFVTGPSRTADIELTLTRGVHGPKEVHAIFVESEIRG